MTTQTNTSSVVEKTFNEETLIEVMTIWEALLEFEIQPDISSDTNAYGEARLNIGACEMRQAVIDVLLNPIKAGWEEICEDYTQSFDWEYVPAFLLEVEPILAKQDVWLLTEADGVAAAKKILKAEQQ
jgi:hypothetical protein